MFFLTVSFIRTVTYDSFHMKHQPSLASLLLAVMFEWSFSWHDQHCIPQCTPGDSNQPQQFDGKCFVDIGQHRPSDNLRVTLTPGKLPSLSLYLKHQSLKFSVSKVSLNLPNLVRGEAWNMIWQMYRNQSTLNLARKVQVLLIDWNSNHRNGYRHQCVSWGRPRTVCKLTIVVHVMYITVTFNSCTSLGLQTQFAIFSGARQRNNRA